MNTLYYGDCLTIMRERMTADSVDLIYLDPPFNSKRDYNAIYKDETGRPLPDQIEAFNDTWALDAERMRVIRNMPTLLREHGIDGHTADFLASFMSGLANTQPDMAAYLAYMAERLVWMKRVLKPTGSIYLHCDPTASHYLKVLMDGIFGKGQFRREVIWNVEDVSGFKSQAQNWIREHDVILYYVGNARQIFNKQYKPLAARTIKRYDKIDEEGKRYKIYREKDGAERRSYLRKDRGAPIGSVWGDIPSFQTVNNTGEYLNYPTQKPLALLERIIKASSNPDDVVFDPFCGCATTIEAANKLGRRWIGIDITIHAIKRVARKRLHDRLHLVAGKDYIIEGVPQNFEGALELWRQDTYQFQKWCVEQVEGFVNAKRSADDGIDGRIYFDMPGEKVLQSMALEVKGGTNVGIKDVRSLNSVLQFENVQLAGLITLWEPSSRQSRNFKQSMALSGHLNIDGREYARMQMLTVQEIFNGKRFNMPRPAGRSETRYDLDLFSHTFNQ